MARLFSCLFFDLIKNIVPSAGCAVIAGDGGVDAVEPDGLACAGGMAATDPLCTEPFKNTAIAALKVTTEPGFVFTGWTVNGAEINTASADTLFLTTMPTLAGLANILPPGVTLATVRVGCPKEVNVLFSFDDGPHSADPSGDNYTIEVLDELAENAVQKHAKAMWCIQTHVPHRGGNSVGQDVIQEQWNQEHVVAIHTGSDEDHIDHRNRVQQPAYDVNKDGVADGQNALESDMIRAKSRIAELTGTVPRYVRPVGGNYNADVLAVYQRQQLKRIHWNIDSYDTHGLDVSQIKERLQILLLEELEHGNNDLIVLFHELKGVTHGHIKEYMRVLQETAKSKNYSVHFPTGRKEVELFLERYTNPD